MVKRIDLMLEMKRTEKAKTLHRTLLSMISRSNFLYDEVSTVDRIR